VRLGRDACCPRNPPSLPVAQDTFWTSDNGNQSTTRGGCDKTGCPPDHSNAGAVLHNMLALFSTGPMGFSDAPGETDAALLARSCDANGTLLQPSRPITSVDSTFDVTPGAAPQGYVLGTHTALFSAGGSSEAVAAHFLLSHQVRPWEGGRGSRSGPFTGLRVFPCLRLLALAPLAAAQGRLLRPQPRLLAAPAPWGPLCRR